MAVVAYPHTTILAGQRVHAVGESILPPERVSRGLGLVMNTFGIL